MSEAVSSSEGLGPRDIGEGEDFASLLDTTVSLARELLTREGMAHTDPEELAAAIETSLGADGLAAEVGLARVFEVLCASPSSSSWRFVNQLFGGREPLAMAADMLVAVPNVSMYTLKAAGAQVLVERALLQHMARHAGIPDAEGCFTPGGSIANLVALLLARNAAVPDARERGLGERELLVYTSAEGHYSIPKNAGIVGIGRERVRLVPTDAAGRMDVAALARQLAEDRANGATPALVNATAGTTVRGVFDPIRAIAKVAREHGAWLHVDGALGGTIVLCPLRRALVDGVELADSLSWNPHKMMGVPLQCSVLLVARPGALAGSLDETADYLFQSHAGDVDPGRRSIQCGRRNDALKLWAAWLRLGDRGWDERIRRQFDIAERAAEKIAADPELELVEPPASINVCFAVRGRSSEAICDRLDRSGRLKIGHGIIGERRVLRLVCVNPELDDTTLDAILAEIKSAARQVGNAPSGSR